MQYDLTDFQCDKLTQSDAKSPVFLWNWATFILLRQVILIFFVRRLKQNPSPPQNPIVFASFPWNTIRHVLAMIVIVLSSNWVCFTKRTWQPWLQEYIFTQNWTKIAK